MSKPGLLHNTLQQWILNDKEKGKFRPFSHVASSPSDVKEWIPVDFTELGGTLAMDKRSVEFLNHQDITFNIGQKGNQTFIQSIEYRGIAPTQPEDEVQS